MATATIEKIDNNAFHYFETTKAGTYILTSSNNIFLRGSRTWVNIADGWQSTSNPSTNVHGRILPIGTILKVLI